MLPLALLCTALALAAAPASAATPASYAAVVRQIRTGPVIRAVINRQLRHVEIKFHDLSEWEAMYPPGAQAGLQHLLRGRHIRVLFASRPAVRASAPVHHHLRYIVGAVLVALATAGFLAIVWNRRTRRRRAAPAQPPAA
jgi:Flp pilus assembly protein TadB